MLLALYAHCVTHARRPWGRGACGGACRMFCVAAAAWRGMQVVCWPATVLVSGAGGADGDQTAALAELLYKLWVASLGMGEGGLWFVCGGALLSPPPPHAPLQSFGHDPLQPDNNAPDLCLHGLLLLALYVLVCVHSASSNPIKTISMVLRNCHHQPQSTC